MLSGIRSFEKPQTHYAEILESMLELPQLFLATMFPADDRRGGHPANPVVG